MKSDPFVHLHVHSHYSLLDGACKTEELVETARRNRMDAVALTDHGNLFGAIEFYKTALAAGIKPIIGCEAYLALGPRGVREGGPSSYFHVTLLVQNDQGYRNLLKMASAAYLDGFGAGHPSSETGYRASNESEGASAPSGDEKSGGSDPAETPQD